MVDLIVVARADLDAINEGGASRDAALVKYFEKFGEIKYSSKRKLSDLWCFAQIMLGRHKKTVILFYPFVGWPYSGNGLFRVILREIGILLIAYAGKRHNLVVDVSDLPELQSKDLGLPEHGNISRFESTIFKVAKKLFIASPGFEKAISDQHNINPNKMVVCLNGGPSVTTVLGNRDRSAKATRSIECVYAGTLTRGRSIEKMIDQFAKVKKVNLNLIGADGEWLADIKLPKNVMYHGSFEQEYAMKFCANCDMGLIPYDQSKLYYNICYPTKTGFYVSAGIPFLSTPCEQIQKVASLHNIGFWANLSDWHLFLDAITLDAIDAERKNIAMVSEKFSWSTIINESYGEFFGDG